jgi:myo-inositol-1(or 4)-monophosphatase
MLHSGQNLWDYAAGSLVLQEAGGSLSALEDEDFWKASLWKRSVIAARTRPLLDEWRAWITSERRQ